VSKSATLRALDDLKRVVDEHRTQRALAAQQEADRRYASDPVAFATERLGWIPDDWQAGFLRSSGNTILNCSRQSGKSTSTAVLALHTALFKPGSLTLLVSPTQRQSAELFKKCKSFMNLLTPPAPLTEDNALSLTMANGSRIVSLPGSPETVRGYSSPALVVIDEAAFVEDATVNALRPMLAVGGGRLMALSTPYGRRGAFFQAWSSPGDEWHKIKITAADCPRISPEFLESERRAIGDWWFRQEFMGEFLETAAQLFRLEDINRALSDDVKPLFAADGRNRDEVKPLFPVAA
jgi:hypothetical protein